MILVGMRGRDRVRRKLVVWCAIAVGLAVMVVLSGGASGSHGGVARAATVSRVYVRASNFSRWTRLRSSTLARCEVSAARIGRFVYVVDGFLAPSSSNSLPTTGVLERYDIRRNRWRRMAPLPVAMNHAVAVAYNGSLYVDGGWPAQVEFNATANFWRFDPRSNRWTVMPPSPTARAANAAAVIGDRLYVAGGANNSGSLRSLEIYNFRQRRWSHGPDFLGPPRNHARGVASGGFFYVVGGRKGGQVLADPSAAVSYADVDRYDPRHHRWRRMRPMLQPRSGFGAVALADGRIVVFGGENWPNNVPGAHVIGTAELFTPKTGRWRRLPNMLTPVHAPGGAALGDRVYSFEGSAQPMAKAPTRLVQELEIP